MGIGETLSFASVRAARRAAAVRPTLKWGPRHIAVAELVAQGLQNKAIGAAMSICEGTVKIYVSEVLALTGLPSRTAIARWVFESQAENVVHLKQAQRAVVILKAWGVGVAA